MGPSLNRAWAGAWAEAGIWIRAVQGQDLAGFESGIGRAGAGVWAGARIWELRPPSPLHPSNPPPFHPSTLPPLHPTHPPPSQPSIP